MPSSAGLEFDKVFTLNGSTWTEITNEMISPAGTATAILNAAGEYLYLGATEKFDMAVFDLATAGSLGALTWQFSTGSSAWKTFVPSSGKYTFDMDDSNTGTTYDFTVDGVEIFPTNILSALASSVTGTLWDTDTFGPSGNTTTLYWIRVSAASVTTAPTLYRMQKRPYATYCTPGDVFRFLQLGQMTGKSDFDKTTTPTKNTVETYIQVAESKIDYLTRKSWKPHYIAEEYHDFNLNGFKLDRGDPYKLLKLEIWNGAGWDLKSQGRANDFFLAKELGMLHFSRYFLLPARFMSYNAPIWRFGGGEFMMPVKVSYLSGRDIHADAREAGMVFDAARKFAAIEVLRDADFGTLVVSGTDRVQLMQKIESWSMETEAMLDTLRAWEVF